MKEKIIEKATDMFLNYGFKSITMDDISTEMGISKKTIYQHFSDKTSLVQGCAFHVFDTISGGIEAIRMQQINPIEELYAIKSFAMKHLKDEKSSPQYQLQKYYPKIYANLKRKKYEVMVNCVTDNLQRGIAGGYFRNDMNTSLISKIYFNNITALTDAEIFPPQQYSMPQLMETYLEYHIRAIATPKGLEALHAIINNPA